MDQVPFMNDERGLLMALRKAEAEVARLTAYKAWAEIEIANDRDDLSRITKQALEAEARIRAVEGLPKQTVRMWVSRKSGFGVEEVEFEAVRFDELQAALRDVVKMSDSADEYDVIDEIKPCPCCGSPASVEEADGENLGAYYIECTRSSCGITTNLRFASGDDPVPHLKSVWNNRQTDDKAAAVREAVEREREEIAIHVQTAMFHEHTTNGKSFTESLADAIRARGGTRHE